MAEPTERKISEALEAVAFAENYSVVGWRFKSSYTWHPEQEARMITRFCLILGQPVSDVLTSSLFSALVDRVLALEEKIQPADQAAVKWSQE